MYGIRTLKGKEMPNNMELFLLPVEHNQTILKKLIVNILLKCKIRALQLLVLATVFGNTCRGTPMLKKVAFQQHIINLEGPWSQVGEDGRQKNCYM